MALLTAVLSIALLASAALGVDIAMQVMEKQKLTDTLDMAAHAGRLRAARQRRSAPRRRRWRWPRANDLGADPTVDLWCVVAATGTPPAVDTTQIPGTCNPGPAPYTAATYPGLRCNNSICAIPCVPAQGDQCNTVRVADSKVVPFAFGPAVGTPEGNTGQRVSVACKGSCGEGSSEPDGRRGRGRPHGLDELRDITSMIAGIKKMLTVMTPTQQYVSLGTIGPAKNNSATVTSTTCRSDPYSGTLSSSGTAWRWMSLPFHNDYLTAGSPPATNSNSHLVKAINCLNRSSSTGTHLAAPLKAAARYLLGHRREQPGRPAGAHRHAAQGHHLRDRRPAERGVLGYEYRPGRQSASYPGNSNGGDGVHQPRERRHQREGGRRSW